MAAPLKLPYSQQFSPKQTPLNKLLAVLRNNAGKPSLTKAIAAAFFKANTDPEKLAVNTVAALRSYTIIADDNTLAPFGAELIAYQGKEQEAHRLLAKRLLLDFNGVALVETLREMAEGGHAIDLPNLAGGCAKSPGSFCNLLVDFRKSLEIVSLPVPK